MDEMIDRGLRIKVCEDSNDGVFDTHQESRSAVTWQIRRRPPSFREGRFGNHSGPSNRHAVAARALLNGIGPLTFRVCGAVTSPAKANARLGNYSDSDARLWSCCSETT
jgi:hypothetical protein